MALVLTILLAFPAGFLIANRTAAYIVYIAAHAFVFSFQNVSLLVDWVGGDESAFGPFPEGSTESLVGYGIINLVIYLVGLGLVYGGSRARQWRSSRRTGSISLDPAR